MRNVQRVLPVLTIPALALGAISPAFAAAPTALSTDARSGLLAATGADVSLWIIAAAVFLGLGALLFFIAQRQRAKARAIEAAEATTQDAVPDAAADALASPEASGAGAGAGAAGDGEERNGDTPV